MEALALAISQKGKHYTWNDGDLKEIDYEEAAYDKLKIIKDSNSVSLRQFLSEEHEKLKNSQ